MRKDPPAPPSLANIKSAYAAGDQDRAIDLAIAAFGSGDEHSLILRLVASGMMQDGLHDDAAGVLHRAFELAPDDADVLAEFGRALATLGRMTEALDMAKKAVEIEPQSYEGHVVAGMASLRLGDVQASQQYYAAAARIAPREAEPVSALSVIASRQGAAGEARRFAEQALTLRPDFVSARMALAQADIFDHAAVSSETHLRALLARPDLDDDQRTEALTMLGDALDAQDRAREAFAAYSVANAILINRHAPTFENSARENRVLHARRLADYFQTAPSPAWSERAGVDHEGADSVAGHVFLLGFPRSGTTLLEQILASHPGVVALEEKPMLADAADDFLVSNQGLDHLSRLTPKEADLARAIYWNGVRNEFKDDISDKIFVDKLPLHTVSLPAISKLFPDSKIIFALRDPRDVVLSCFRRRFRVNEAMYRFLDLQSAAQYYNETMRCADIYKRCLPIDMYTLRHEQLVANFDVEAEAVLNHIGVDWDPNVRNFSKRARTSSSTPSAPQLAKGLSSEGVGQWKRYEKWLAPIVGLVEPWVTYFGYPPSDAEPATVRDPRLTSIVGEAATAASRADWATAFEIADKAERSGLRDSYFNRLLAVRAQQEGRLEEAVARFESVLDEQPADFAVLSAVGLCLARSGRATLGLSRLDDAIAFQPGFAPAHYNRGWTLEALGDISGAREAYVRTLQLDPGNAQALANLAALAVRAADWSNARKFATRALGLDAGHPTAAIALAAAEAAAGALSEAEARLRATIANTRRMGEHEGAVAHARLGDVLDRRGNYTAAFSAYQAANDQLSSIYSPRFQRPDVETGLARTRRLLAYFQHADPAVWKEAVPVEAAIATPPVFLLGFPRSGTTLLGQALALHPDIVTLDERETLADSALRFMADERSLDELSRASLDEIKLYRSLYVKRVGTNTRPTSRLTIDKLPMNTVMIPVIAKLFSSSRIIFMRRDPRDIVLSCFRRQFSMDPTTVEFLSLHRCVDFYIDTMKLFDIYMDKLNINVHMVKYEVLIGSFEEETRKICQFLDLPWAPGMDQVASRASMVATPSSSQLALGLNFESIGHWRCYREQVAPELQRLAPWVERFGYPLA